jgi:hypothetical protein
VKVEDIKIGLEVKYENKAVTIINYNRETTDDSLSPDVVIGLNEGWRCDVNHNKLELIVNSKRENIKAIDLYNVLKQYSQDELKELDIVIETNRGKHNQLGNSEYATIVEEYSSQIRIIQKEGN